MFVTTSALNHASVFGEHALRDTAVECLYAEHVHYRAVLHAFVVMSNHIHFLTTLPVDRDASSFVQRVKVGIALEVKPKLSASVRAVLGEQAGLGGRTFWERSFRSFPVTSDEVFRQKAAYIHQNPVRAGLVMCPEHYVWSSAALFARSLWDEVRGVMDAMPGYLAALRQA
ncbi:MAG: transposase [Fimbriimonadales bacterium]